LEEIFLTDNEDIVVSRIKYPNVTQNIDVQINIIDQSIQKLETQPNLFQDTLPFESRSFQHFLFNYSNSVYWVVKDENNQLLFNKTHSLLTENHLHSFEDFYYFTNDSYFLNDTLYPMAFYSANFNQTYLVSDFKILISSLDPNSNLSNILGWYDVSERKIEINQKYNIIRDFQDIGSCGSITIYYKITNNSLTHLFGDRSRTDHSFITPRLFDQRTNNSIKIVFNDSSKASGLFIKNSVTSEEINVLFSQHELSTLIETLSPTIPTITSTGINPLTPTHFLDGFLLFLLLISVIVLTNRLANTKK
jgi:hypothetical protein